MKYLVTLDITVDANSRDDALEKVEGVLGSQTFCLYDAEAVEQSVQRIGGRQHAKWCSYVNNGDICDCVGWRPPTANASLSER